MNSIEKSDPNLNFLGMPSELWNNVFGTLSHRRVFLIFPQVSKACVDLVEKYRVQFDREENYWKMLCYEEMHVAWDGKELKPIEKGLFLSWKKVYLASNPSYYINKRRKYEKKISECQEKIRTASQFDLYNSYVSIKKYVWWNSEQEIADQQEKVELISTYENEKELIKQKREKLYSENNLEKLVVRTIGKNRFEQIPLIEDFFHIKGLTFEDSLEPIMWYYLRDSSFPSIVRGETVSGAKYLLLHTQNMDKETNEPYGESHIFIHSEENTLRVWQQTKFSNISAMTSCSTGVITNEIIEKLQDLISTGAYTKSKGT